MPNLVSIDVSVTDDRIRLVFSDRAVAAAYAAYLRAQDVRPPQYQTLPGYQRTPQLHTTSREVSLSLPSFITWFITCRLPDDEDAVTFTYMPEHARQATRWAETMLLFEPVRPDEDDDDEEDEDDYYYYYGDARGSARGYQYRQHSNPKQLHVRRLWNRAYLLKRLEELRRRTPPARSRVGSPVWGHGGSGGVGANGGASGGPNGVHAGVSTGGTGGRMPVALTVSGVAQRGDIWW
ncbi:hypothetical protein VTH06DRAFT_2365 [Thermothelomyces fergusii]